MQRPKGFGIDSCFIISIFLKLVYPSVHLIFSFFYAMGSSFKETLTCFVPGRILLKNDQRLAQFLKGGHMNAYVLLFYWIFLNILFQTKVQIFSRLRIRNIAALYVTFNSYYIKRAQTWLSLDWYYNLRRKLISLIYYCKFKVRSSILLLLLLIFSLSTFVMIH